MHDAAGNRKSLSNGATTTSYTYDAANRMTAAGAATFSYDKNGNTTGRTEGGTTNYSYDFEDRLTRAGDATYAYDAFGRKVSKERGGEKTEYLFDGSEVLQETTSGESTGYTRGLADQLISRKQGTSPPSYYHHDAIGSVTGLSDEGGNLTDSWSYDAFGNVLATTGSTPNPYGYVANRQEGSAGLSNFHARHYEPATGRFTSKDPVAGLRAMPQTLNPYAYGVNGPLAHPDPSGRFPICAVPVLGWAGCTAAVVVGAPVAVGGAVGCAISEVGCTAAIWPSEPGNPQQEEEEVPAPAPEPPEPSTGDSHLNEPPKVVTTPSSGGDGGESCSISGRNFPRPPVRDTSTKAGKELDGAFEELFRKEDRYPGGTAGYVRRYGDPGHTEKAQTRAKQLQRLIDEGNLSPADEQTAFLVYMELMNAIDCAGEGP